VSNVNPQEVAASSKSDRHSDLDKFFSVIWKVGRMTMSITGLSWNVASYCSRILKLLIASESQCLCQAFALNPET
jgi:hypothetical protein